MRRFVTRRALLAASGVFAASWTPFVRGGSAKLSPPVEESVSLRAFGARGDGATDDAPALIRALGRGSARAIRVPAGTYLLSNPIDVVDFHGQLLFDPGALFVFRDVSASGLSFQGGTGAAISGYRARWRAYPKVRLNYGGALAFGRAVRPVVIGCVIENSPVTGVQFDECVQPCLEEAEIGHTLADGIHLANCADAEVANVRTNDTGDDGLAFVSYRSKPAFRGGRARNVSVRNSKARGIAVPGQSDVEIVDFHVDNTSAAGIYVAHERNWNTRRPEGVAFRRGRVDNAGQLLPKTGGQCGIEILDAASAFIEDVVINRSFYRGVSIEAAEGTVELKRLNIRESERDSAINVTASEARLIDVVVEGAAAYGLYAWRCGRVFVRQLKLVDVSRTLGLRRAAWFDYNGEVDVDGIEVRQQGRAVSVGAAGPQKGRVRALTGQGPGNGMLFDGRGSPAISVEP